MPAVARIGDIGAGHGCFPDSPATSGNTSVEINGIPVVCVGDSFATHGCPTCPPHGRALAAGSGSVFIGGKPVGRVGDPIDCGGTVSTGSEDVDIG